MKVIREQLVNVGAVLFVVVAVGCGSRPDVGTEPTAIDPTESAKSTLSPDQGPSRSTSATCSGFGCDNKDPKVTGCTASTVKVQVTNIYRYGTSTKIGYVTLWYSDTCGTNWSQVTRTDGQCSRYMDAIVERGGSYPAHLDTGLAGYCEIYGNMLYAPSYPARACGVIDGNGYSGNNCTGWH